MHVEEIIAVKLTHVGQQRSEHNRVLI